MISAVGMLRPALEHSPVIGILRGVDEGHALRRACTAVAAGVRCLEVTIETGAGRRALAAIVRECGADAIVGAGTVRTAADARFAVDAGARFTISPGLDAATVTTSADAGVPHVPGVATATEVLTAQALGLSCVKAFPAVVLGPAWLRAMAGPFPDIDFLATGGVTGVNADTFLSAGALGVGISLREDGDAQLAVLRDAGTLPAR